MPPVMPGQVIMTQDQGQPVPIQNFMMVSSQQHRSFLLDFIFYFLPPARKKLQGLCPRVFCFECLSVFHISFLFNCSQINILLSFPHLNVVIVLK